MTVARSKYYMLKVNYPKLAEIIDNEPLLNQEDELKAEELKEKHTAISATQSQINLKSLESQTKTIIEEKDDP